LVVPVGECVQDLWVWTRTQSGFDKRNVLPVRFVPMTGRAQQRDDSERPSGGVARGTR